MELLEWDAKTYDTLTLPHVRWGGGVVERLAASAGESIVDLGCGTGRDAQRVLDAEPTVRMLCVDGSHQMLDQARLRLAANSHRVGFLWADLRQPLHLDARADAVMSVAALHWLPDHPAIFHSVASSLRPGGRFVAEWGGQGNIAAVRAAVATVSGQPDAAVWEFADAAVTRRRLIAAGFCEAKVVSVPDPVPMERGPQLEAFLATVVLAADLRGLDPRRRGPFVRAVVAALAEPVVDFVRLQVTARLPDRSA